MKFASIIITTLVAAPHFSSTCATVNPKDDAVETSDGRLVSFNALDNDTSDKSNPIGVIALDLYG
jgi:hypothetical protein